MAIELLTAALVLVTIWYAWSTHRMLGEMKRQRAAGAETLEAMKRQADLLSYSVELQTALAEMQVLQARGLEPEQLKQLLGLRNRIREIRDSIQASPPLVPPTHS